MIISLINHTNGKLTDEEVQNTIRAINRQIKEDYEPYWSLGATLRLEGKAGAKPKQQEPRDMRGDAVLYLWDNVNVANAWVTTRETTAAYLSASFLPSFRKAWEKDVP